MEADPTGPLEEDIEENKMMLTILQQHLWKFIKICAQLLIKLHHKFKALVKRVNQSVKKDFSILYIKNNPEE
jgi:hypothetical protein